jgi:hypothetical protein
VSLRTLGFLLTSAAVVGLLASLVIGMRAEAPPPPIEEPEPVRIRERVRVEVLNAAGVTGLARDVTEQLRGLGFDVVFYGNAGALARDSTTVLDRTGDPYHAWLVADALGGLPVETAVDTTLYVEATVILAPDWVVRER